MHWVKRGGGRRDFALLDSPAYPSTFLACDYQASRCRGQRSYFYWYVLDLPIPSPDERNSFLVREEKSRKKRLCTGDSLNGTLRFLLCDVTLSPEEATAASSQDPNILYRRMAYLEANALGQESWWYEGFKPTR